MYKHDDKPPRLTLHLPSITTARSRTMQTPLHNRRHHMSKFALPPVNQGTQSTRGQPADRATLNDHATYQQTKQRFNPHYAPPYSSRHRLLLFE